MGITWLAGAKEDGLRVDIELELLIQRLV